MRKILSIILFICFAFSANAQRISGLGPFTIGRTIAIIDSLKNIGYTEFDGDQLNYSFQPERMFRASSIGNQSNHSIAIIKSSLPGKKTFVLSQVEIAGINIKALELMFYNDTLYFVGLRKTSHDLLQALKMKYKSESLSADVTNVNTSSKYSVTEYTFDSAENLESKAKEYNYQIGRDSDASLEYRFYVKNILTGEILRNISQQKKDEDEKLKLKNLDKL